MITDTQAIGGRLQDQRWFGYKGRTISGVELVDEATIDDGPPALVIALIRVVMEGGSRR